MVDFERRFRKMALKLFANAKWPDFDSFTPQESEFLMYILGSGTFGNASNVIRSRVSDYVRESKNGYSVIGYCLYRLFPEKRWFEIYRPDLVNHPVRMFLFNLGRIGRAVYMLPRAVREIRAAFVQKFKKDERKW